MSLFICILAVIIRHEKGIRRIVLLSLAFLVLPYFSTFSHKRQDFQEKVTEHEMCVLILSTTFV